MMIHSWQLDTDGGAGPKVSVVVQKKKVCRLRKEMGVWLAGTQAYVG